MNKNNQKYNLRPEITMNSIGVVTSFEDILASIKKYNYKDILIETYPGVNIKEIEQKLLANVEKKYKLHWSENYALQGNKFRNAIIDELTEDRVFGRWTRRKYRDFFIGDLPIKKISDFNIFYGTGATYLVDKPDLVIYIDINRWEIQTRYRNKERVFFGGTLEKESTSNFKRGYFIEWRMADKIKKRVLRDVDWYVDGNNNEFKTIKGITFWDSLENATSRPFRLVPYFDYGVWGGKWMEKNLGLGDNEYSRWAWGFDGVPEENSVIFRYENNYIEMPAINLVIFKPKNILGQRVWNRFGEEYPIRFDLLDTIKGGNLSLQVHPDFQYIRDNFWAPYTQEESYYILDTDESENPTCYLGFKNNINEKEFIDDLKKAQSSNEMNVDKYVNKFSVKKHDHLLHPAGVIHSSGTGCMVLEISATPYIFTFKLWDWGRKGLNGLPRPINVDHGSKVLDYSFNTNKTRDELVNNFKVLIDNNKMLEERTGLHSRQFIETRRVTIKAEEGIIFDCHNSTNMLNLVEGSSVIIESLNNEFESLVINYAETFIVPEKCKKYRIRSLDTNRKTMILQAFVRTNS